jgi:hypothetical protein
MARVTYGALITNIAGSIGGSTFQNNASGAIVRSKPFTPVNPSASQSARQLILTQLVALWPTLTNAQKTAWNNMAAAHLKINDWGSSVRVSGYQWFIAYNLNAYTQGDAPWLIPEAYSLVPPPNAFTLSAVADHFYINWPSPETMPGTWAAVFATQPMRQSSIKLRKSTFFIKLYHASAITQLDIVNDYCNYFNLVWNSFIASTNCSIIIRQKYYNEDTGFASPFTSALIQIG